jgi:hypothetical protein
MSLPNKGKCKVILVLKFTLGLFKKFSCSYYVTLEWYGYYIRLGMCNPYRRAHSFYGRSLPLRIPILQAVSNSSDKDVKNIKHKLDTMITGTSFVIIIMKVRFYCYASDGYYWLLWLLHSGSSYSVAPTSHVRVYATLLLPIRPIRNWKVWVRGVASSGVTSMSNFIKRSRPVVGHIGRHGLHIVKRKRK